MTFANVTKAYRCVGNSEMTVESLRASKISDLVDLDGQDTPFCPSYGNNMNAVVICETVIASLLLLTVPSV